MDEEEARKIEDAQAAAKSERNRDNQKTIRSCFTAGLVILAVVLLFVAIVSNTGNNTAVEPLPTTPELTSSEPALPAPSTDSNSVHVSRSEMGSDWPLTVDEGAITYDRGVVFESGGVKYAVNGTAMQNHPDYPVITEIQADDPKYPDLLKKDVGPILDRGLELRDR